MEEDVFITIEPNWYDYHGTLCSEGWVCASLNPQIQVIGRTRLDALTNWENLYWMNKNPEIVEDVSNEMIMEFHSENRI